MVSLRRPEVKPWNSQCVAFVILGRMLGKPRSGRARCTCRGCASRQRNSVTRDRRGVDRSHRQVATFSEGNRRTALLTGALFLDRCGIEGWIVDSDEIG